MSAEMMGLVFKCYPGSAADLALALALADHAHDDGTNIFPSVASVAQKSRQSESSVKRQLRSLRECGWLVSVGGEKGGRRISRLYRINPDWIQRATAAVAAQKKRREKGVMLTPFRAPLDNDPTPQCADGHDAQRLAAESHSASTPAAMGQDSGDAQSRERGTEGSQHARKGGQPDTVSRGSKGGPHAERGSLEAEKGVTAVTDEPSGILRSKNSPQPPKRGATALTRPGRKPRELRGGSLQVWLRICELVDETTKTPGSTWSDTRLRLANEPAHGVVERIGGYRAIAARDRFSAGELKRRFREGLEQATDPPQGEEHAA